MEVSFAGLAQATLLGSKTVTVAAGDKVTAVFPLAEVPSYLSDSVDPDNTVPESDERNNSWGREIPAQPLVYKHWDEYR